jgi:N-terminal 7TM region of histidine kinase
VGASDGSSFGISSPDVQSTPYTLPIIATGVVAAGTAIHVVRRRGPNVGVREFAVVALSMATISFAYAAELTSATLRWQLFWLGVRYVGICVGSLAAFVLALRWTGKGAWLTRRRFVLLAAIPTVTLLLAWTNEWHFIVQGPSLEQASADGMESIFV